MIQPQEIFVHTTIVYKFPVAKPALNHSVALCLKIFKGIVSRTFFVTFFLSVRVFSDLNTTFTMFYVLTHCGFLFMQFMAVRGLNFCTAQNSGKPTKYCLKIQ